MKGNTMASEQLTIKINGKDTPAPAGALLLHVLRDVGVDVPTLCHDERLTPYGGCRLCVVARRDGRGGLVPSCSTPVQRGMEMALEKIGAGRAHVCGPEACDPGARLEPVKGAVF